MSRRIVVLAAAVAAVVAAPVAPAANAQIMRNPAAVEPDWWTSLGVGLFQSQSVADGSTSSTWDFGSAVQYRASLDRTISRGTTLGIAMTFARVPVTYTGGGLTAHSCLQCDADANVTQLFAVFHAGGGNVGFHQVIEGSLGTTLYSNFRARSDGRRLDPSSDGDVAFALGYGFGYGMSPYTHVTVVQEVAASLHQSTGLSANTNTTIRSYTTRIGLQVGLGR